MKKRKLVRPLILLAIAGAFVASSVGVVPTAQAAESSASAVDGTATPSATTSTCKLIQAGRRLRCVATDVTTQEYCLDMPEQTYSERIRITRFEGKPFDLTMPRQLVCATKKSVSTRMEVRDTRNGALVRRSVRGPRNTYSGVTVSIPNNNKVRCLLDPALAFIFGARAEDPITNPVGGNTKDTVSAAWCNFELKVLGYTASAVLRREFILDDTTGTIHAFVTTQTCFWGQTGCLPSASLDYRTQTAPTG